MLQIKETCIGVMPEMRLSMITAATSAPFFYLSGLADHKNTVSFIITILLVIKIGLSIDFFDLWTLLSYFLIQLIYLGIFCLDYLLESS